VDMSYKTIIQKKNMAWYLPRPRPDYYKGGMPLYCEEWLLDVARGILGKKDIAILIYLVECVNKDAGMM